MSALAQSAPSVQDLRHPAVPAVAVGFRSTALSWLALLAYVALAKLLLDAFLPHAFAAADQRAAFAWPAIGVMGLLGLAGCWFAARTGFPAAWDGRVLNTRRILLPFLIGLGLAAAQVAFDQATGYSRLNDAAHGVARQYTDGPSMLLIFSAAAILVQPLYRLFLIPLPLWLVSNVLLRGRWHAQVFWALAVSASLLEPLSQTGVVAGVGPAVRLGMLTLGFAVNLLEAACFRRYGLLAPVALREGFYLIWHVLYVH